MGKVFIMDHPLIQHKIGIIRNIETGTKQFRELISEIATLECFEATRDLELEDYPVTTPMGDTVCKKIAGKKLAIIPILRAGLGMVSGMETLLPAAKIGHGLLIDHATNIVIGETAVVGNNVSFLHGVTLGGTGNEVGDRHPKIGNGVMLGAHAQLLGNIHIGDCAKIGAGAVVLTDVPPHTTYAGVPAVEVGHPDDETPSFNMQQDFTRDCR